MFWELVLATLGILGMVPDLDAAKYRTRAHAHAVIRSVPPCWSCVAVHALTLSKSPDVRDFAERLVGLWQGRFDDAILERLSRETAADKPWVWLQEIEDNHPRSIELANRLGPTVNAILRDKYPCGWLSIFDTEGFALARGQLSLDVYTIMNCCSPCYP